MNADCYSTYVNMFYALDAYWDEHHDESLGAFLSDANPFLFQGLNSADPAVWAEFSKAFTKRFPNGSPSLEEAYKFVCSYLNNINKDYADLSSSGITLEEAFQAVAPINEWCRVFEHYDDPDK